MRRSSTKKAVQAASTTSVNPSPADLLRTLSSKATSKELERIDSLFFAYVNGASGLIEYVMIESIHLIIFPEIASEEPILAPEGIESLCADMEVDHTDDEWRRGLKTLGADTIGKLKKALPELEKDVKSPSNFVDFYAYAFHYCLTEEKQKSIDIESISELLDLVLGNQFRAQVVYFTEYLKISFPDFSNYDQELAWPLVLDNFVDWMRAKQG